MLNMAEAGFLTQSLSKAQWHLSQWDDAHSQAIAQRFNLEPIVSDFLAARGMDIEEIEGFLNPKLKHELPNPSRFQDMDKAAMRIMEAIEAKQKIAIFGDFDVDGATSAALWHRFLSMLGITPMLYIPDRIKEGYGPNAPALLALQQQGVELVITVDCGISAFDALATAKAHGLDVIVLDHHQASPNLPASYAIVNPNRLDEDCKGYENLAAVGVCFLTIIAVNRLLKAENHYKKNHLSEPDLLSLLDLVALGTICDVVSLQGLNRALVAQGLKIMAQRENLGLTRLLDRAGVNEPPSAYHCGFVIGPRINAGGRVGQSYLGANLLSTQDEKQVEEYCQRLELFNQERKELEQICLEEAIYQVENQEKNHEWFILTAAQNWHPGVIGIVAGRLKERFYRPSFVLSIGENGIAKGSARSVGDVDIGSIVASARDMGLLINGGGHKMAAGLTIAQTHIKDFCEFLHEHIRTSRDNFPLIAKQKADGIMPPHSISLASCDALERLAPFGAGNPQPRYILSPVHIARSQIVGEQHIRLWIKNQDGSQLEAMAFNALTSPYGSALLNAKRETSFMLLGRIKRNSWQGVDKVQFLIDDVALS